MLGGFTARKGEVEAQNRADAAASHDREGRILQALLNSDDPEVKSHAVAGMLDWANPQTRKKGISGWVGEMQANPHMDAIRALVEHDRQMGRPETEASVALAEPAPAAAQPVTAAAPAVGTPPPRAAEPVQPANASPAPNQFGQPAAPRRFGLPDLAAAGALDPAIVQQEPQEPIAAASTGPPPAQSGQTGPPPQAILGQAAPPSAVDRQTPTPRRGRGEIFRSPETQARLTKKAQAQGDVEGDVAGYEAVDVPHADAVAQVRAERLRRGMGYGGGGYQSVAGEITENGRTIGVLGAFDRMRGVYIGTDPDSDYYGIPIPGFRPKTTGAGANPFYGQDREAIAKAIYQKSFKDLAPEEAADVNTRRTQQLQTDATARGTGSGIAAFNKPIGVSEAQRTNTEVGATSAQYAGQEVPSTAEQDTRRGVEEVKAQLAHIRTLLGPLPKSTELAGVAPGAALAIRRRSPQYRTQIAQLEAAIDNIVNVLARSVGQQRGAQTEQDATRAYNTIVALKARLLDPFAGDTQESAAARITETEQYLKTVLGMLPGTPVAAPKPVVGQVGAPPPATAAPAPGAPPPAPQPFTPATIRPVTSRAAPATRPATGVPRTYKDAQGVWHVQQ